MKITIDIPDEFESHFEMDGFKDSLERIVSDIEFAFEKMLKDDCTVLSGRYEIETLNMLKDAFCEAFDKHKSISAYSARLI